MDAKKKRCGEPDAGPGRWGARAADRETRRQLYPNGVDILAIVGILLVSALAAGLVGGALGMFTRWDAGMVMALTYFLQMGLAIAFVLLQRRSRHAPPDVLRFHKGRLSAPLILWGILLISVTGVVIEPLLALFPDEYLDLLYRNIGTGGWSILMTVVLAPVMEETLFRGLIQGSVYERDGAAKSILLSALLFGVFHMIPQQVINAFLVGIILGYIYFRTGSLLTVIILHALNNGISYLMLELLGPEQADRTVRDLLGDGGLYYAVYGVCAVLLVVGAVVIVRRLKRQQEPNVPAADDNETGAE